MSRASELAWTCPFCGGAHRKQQDKCRLCTSQRAQSPVAAVPGAGASRSPEAITTERATLLQLKQAMLNAGLPTSDIERRLEVLEREEAPPKLPHNLYDEKRRALARAEGLVKTLESKHESLEQRLAELKADLAATEAGLAKARALHVTAVGECDAAAAALRRPGNSLGTAIANGIASGDASIEKDLVELMDWVAKVRASPEAAAEEHGKSGSADDIHKWLFDRLVLSMTPKVDLFKQMLQGAPSAKRLKFGTAGADAEMTGG